MSNHSRSKSRRRVPTTSTPYVPQAEGLILADGAVGEDAVELLGELVHHHEAEETLIGAPENVIHDDQLGLPWWKRRSALWILILTPFTAIAMSATLAPRIEIYTMLACSVHKPDIFERGYMLGFMSSSNDAFDINLMIQTAGTDTKSNLCASDPVVQAAVAKLTAVITTTMGVIGCLTTAWWGSFSDRHGRTRVMGISILGLLLADINFILVALFFRIIPGGYWALLVSPIFEGCLGGMSTAIAANHAYVADTTNPATRSQTFSLALGLLFTGMAIGPTVGSMVIRVSHSVLSVFYVAMVIHIIFALMVWFVIPESLPRGQMSDSKIRYAEESLDAARGCQNGDQMGFSHKLKRLFGFLTPLNIFLPEVTESGGNPLKHKKDWGLTLLALGYGFTISLMGTYTFKFQYAASTFGWTSETLGYWLTLVGIVRASFLTIILPTIIKLFKPKPIYIRLAQEPTESEPLLSPSTSSFPPRPPRPTELKAMHSPKFDLNLARVSLFIEMIAYTFMALASTALPFAVFSVMGSFGAGFSPALQSVALEMYAKRGGTESGRLFGALSVVQALCSQILAPSIYGLVYMKTVATFPQAIFFMSVGCVAVSFVLLSLVRLPQENQETAVDVEEQELAVDDVVGHTRDAEGTLVDLADAGRIDKGKHSVASGSTI